MIFLSSPAMTTPHDESMSVGVSLRPDTRFRRSPLDLSFETFLKTQSIPPFGHLAANLSAVLAFFKLIELEHALLVLGWSLQFSAAFPYIAQTKALRERFSLQPSLALCISFI